jgi:hypothetical protein
VRIGFIAVGQAVAVRIRIGEIGAGLVFTLVWNAVDVGIEVCIGRVGRLRPLVISQLSSMLSASSSSAGSSAIAIPGITSSSDKTQLRSVLLSVLGTVRLEVVATEASITVPLLCFGVTHVERRPRTI